MKPNGLSFAVRCAVLSSTMILAACGSGGGSKDTPIDPVPVTPAPTQPPVTPPSTPSPPQIPAVYTPSVFSVPNLGAPSPTTNTLAYSHLRPTNVDKAHAQGITGKGVKIGLVDTDPNVFHPTLQGQISAVTNTIEGNTNTSITGPENHGTVVSQILAGKGLGMFQGGVAPDATLYVVGASTKNEGKNVFPVAATIKANEWLATQNVAVVNNSWNGDPIVNWESESKQWNTYAASAQKVINSNAVMVYSSGNAQGSQPGILSVLPLAYKDLERGWLSVSSYDTSTQKLAQHSNACGLSQNWCLVAPGTVLAYDPTSNAQTGNLSASYQSWMGTSFAAPQVSGTVALVAQAFPWMSNDQIRHTILGTATDLGAPGVDEVYGYGLLNAGKAVNGLEWLNWGTESLNVTAGQYVFSNNLFGAGGIEKHGAGSLKLSGNNTHTGPTTVYNGTLQLSGTSHSPTTITPSGTLELSGVLNSSVFNNGAVTFKGGHVQSVQQTPNGTWNAVLGAPVSIENTAILAGTLVVKDKISEDYIVQSRENLATAGQFLGGFSSTSFAAGLLLNGTVNVSSTSIDVDIVRTNPTTLAAFQSSPIAQELGVQLENTLHVADRLSAIDTSSPFVTTLARVQSITDPQQLYAFGQMYSLQPHISAFNTIALAQHSHTAFMHDRLPSSLGETSGAYASVSSDDWSHTPNGWLNSSLSSTTTTIGGDWSNGTTVVGANWNTSDGNVKIQEQSSKLNTDTISVYAGHALGDWEGMLHVSHGEGRWKNTTREKIQHTLWGLDIARPITTDVGRLVPSVSWTNSQHRLKSHTAFENTPFEMGVSSPSLQLQSWSANIGFTSNPFASVSGWRHTWGANLGWERVDQHNGQWRSYYRVDPSEVFSHTYKQLDNQYWKVGANWEMEKDRYKIFARWDGRYGSEMGSHGWQIGARLAF